MVIWYWVNSGHCLPLRFPEESLGEKSATSDLNETGLSYGEYKLSLRSAPRESSALCPSLLPLEDATIPLILQKEMSAPVTIYEKSSIAHYTRRVIEPFCNGHRLWLIKYTPLDHLWGIFSAIVCPWLDFDLPPLWGAIEGRSSNFLPHWLKTCCQQSAISQRKILWNTPPQLRIEPGPQRGQWDTFILPQSHHEYGKFLVTPILRMLVRRTSGC